MGLPQNIRDTQCGFKLFPSKIAKELYKECITDGFMIDIEMILRALGKGLKVKEFPVSWTSDLESRYKVFSGTARNFRELLIIKKALK
ncbi:hypothetical protein A2Z23_01745 [Candidatus Curtissbacteria bacterium RBG_16_39_7]|uniref:Glycosyltransferase 2-like domain-containing protein n=1 Tax=Candidatus Curtissbacteria bacterium RBG_16_39_7 TaxID=1797707 RepID=A0A1F5G4Y3_9BACT|nr:MAG: hypothetical protein A2Z23_01745 [Candidatus Curtissbacteria bacterium RBG_16_39_7]